MENGNQVTHTNLHKKGSAGYRTKYLQPASVFRYYQVKATTKPFSSLVAALAAAPISCPRSGGGSLCLPCPVD